MRTVRTAGWSGRAGAAVAAATLLAGGGVASAAVTPHASAPGTISTIAGGLGGPGVASQIAVGYTNGMIYRGGRLYLSVGGALRQLDPATDELTTLAGNGEYGYLGNGGPATQATLGPGEVSMDPAGNLVTFDSYGFRVRVVAQRTGTFYGQAMTAGHIYSIAGDGQIGQASLGGLATKTRLDAGGLAVDAAGNVVLGNEAQVVVVAGSTGTFYGKAMTAGHIYRIAGTGKGGYSGNTGLAIHAKLSGAAGITLDPAGNVLFTDSINNRVRVVAEQTGTFYGQAMTAGHIYTIAGNGTANRGNGGLALKEGMGHPAGLALDATGNVLVADAGHEVVRVIAEQTGTFYGQAMTAGHIYLLAGNATSHTAGPFGGPATKAALGGPVEVAVDGNGNVVIGAASEDPVLVVAKSDGTFYGQAMTAGDIYAVAGTGGQESGIGGPATSAVLSAHGTGDETTDAAGNILVDDSTGRVLVLAEKSGTFYGQAMTAGNLYSIAGDGSDGFSGDGGPATAAHLGQNQGVAVDAHGNVLIADTGNGRVRVVAASTGTFYGQAMTAGDIYTIAGTGTAGFSGDGGSATGAELDQPAAVTTGSGGNVLVADSGNARIRVIAVSTGMFYGQAMTAGDIYTIAGTGTVGFSGNGSPATGAEFSAMDGLATDGHGNILVADSGNARIRVIATSTGTFYGRAMTAGDVYTVAGNGHGGFSGDGGPATKAAFTNPQEVTVDGSGNLVLADTYNDRVRVVAESTATFYGQAMTAGDVYTVAGSTFAGYTGDGGPGTDAEIAQAVGVTVDQKGDLIIADTGNRRLREVTG